MDLKITLILKMTIFKDQCNFLVNRVIGNHIIRSTNSIIKLPMSWKYLTSPYMYLKCTWNIHLAFAVTITKTSIHKFIVFDFCLLFIDCYPNWRRTRWHGSNPKRREQTGHMPGEVPAGGVTIGWAIRDASLFYVSTTFLEPL
jgi:hypothetical protein